MRVALRTVLVAVAAVGDPAPPRVRRGRVRMLATRRLDVAAACVWPLLSRPASWHRWAPHVRGAWGLGEPEVVAGARGAARLLGVVPVPAVVTAKQPGRAWTWRVGPVELEHRVDPLPDGCRVTIALRAPAVVEPAVAAVYGPVTALVLANLARVAEAPRR